MMIIIIAVVTYDVDAWCMKKNTSRDNNCVDVHQPTFVVLFSCMFKTIIPLIWPYFAQFKTIKFQRNTSFF